MLEWGIFIAGIYVFVALTAYAWHGKAKVYEWPIEIGPIAGGFEIFTYQVAIGISIRWWSCLRTPALRLYLGPFKLWLYVMRAGIGGSGATSRRSTWR